MYHVQKLLILLPLIAGPMNDIRAEDFEPLKYNNPGLVVDLGVGLWAWPLPMDFDGDGDFDLIVSCPDKPSNGTYFFENTAGDVPFPTFKPGVKIGPGHRNIRVSWVDGKPRVLTPGTEYSDFPKNRFDSPVSLKVPGNVLSHRRKLRANQWHILDYNADGQLDLLVGIGDWSDYGWDDAWDSKGRWKNGPLRGQVHLLGGFRNRNPNVDPTTSSFMALKAGGKQLEVYGWPSPNFADFDGDGDLDLLCGEFLDRFTYFENTGTRKKPEYAEGRFLKIGGDLLKMELQMIVPSAIDWDKDGDVDLVCGDEDGRVALIEHSGKLKDGVPVFETPRYFQQEADKLKCGALATPYCIDWDGDGDEDILSGNTAGYVELFENLGIRDGNETPTWAAPKKLKAGDEVIRIQAGPNGSIQGPCEAKWGYTTFTVADWDHDGLNDIVLNSIWGRVLFYRNVGSKTQPKLAAAQPINVEWPAETPKPAWTWWNPKGKELVTQWRTTPVIVDMNNDGLNDLVMLDHEGYVALFERKASEAEDSSPTLLPGRRIFIDIRGEPVRLNGGHAGKSGRRKLHAVDWDDDGDLDLLLNSVNADLLENMGGEDGEVLLINRGPLGKRRLAGHTSSPCTANFFKTKKRDLLVGAEDGLLYLMRRGDQ